MDDRKAAERQAHVQRRAEEAPRPGRGHVDPFPLNVQRGGRDGADQTYIEAPTVPKDFSGIHVFYSAETLRVLLDKLNSAMESMGRMPRVTLKLQAAKVCTGSCFADLVRVGSSGLTC